MEYKHANEFDKYRDWLLDCSDKGIGYIEDLKQESALSNLLKDAEYRLLYSQTILQKNIIPINPFAASQTGKSTTTSAMVDGRNISPRGKGGGGLRTTAVPLTLYYDPEKTASELSLYSREELVNQVLESAGSHLDSGRQEPYDLDNPDDVALLWEALEAEFDLFCKDPGFSLNREALLKHALLIMHFYGCEAYQKLYAGKITEDEINKFIAFSTDPEVCWKRLRERGIDLLNDLNENGQPLFDQVENLHVFIRSVSRPVDSEFMKETGTAVIDAPGIKMSVEDTRRALKCASEAAVVLYLLDGEHQLTQEDKEMLRTLRDAGLSDKVIFAINFRRSVEAIKASGVEKSLLSSIEEAGFTAPQHKQLLYYNALLALLAAQGGLILRGELDAATEMQIRTEAEHTYPKMKDRFAAMDVEKIWEYMVRKLLMSLNEDEVEEVLSEEGLCENTLELIRKASRWDDAVQKLRDFVLENRASGVLRDLGAQPICDVLNAIEDGLSLCEQDALRSEKDAQSEYDAAKSLLDKYSEEVECVIDDRLGGDMDTGLADDYIDSVLLGAVPGTAQEAAVRIYEENSLMKNIRVIGARALQMGQKIVNAVGSWFSNDELVHVKKVESVKERCADIAKTSYETHIAELHTKWNANLESTPVYEQRVKRPVERVMKDMERKWTELGLNQNNLIGKTPALPVDITGSLSKDVVNVKRMYDELSYGMNVPVNISPVLTGWLAGAGVQAGLYIIYMYLLPIDFIIPGFGTIMTIAALAVMALVTLISNDAKERQILKIQEELEKSICAEISKRRSEIRKNVIEGTLKEPGLRFVREFYTSAFAMTIQHQREELEKKFSQVKAMLALHAVERARIAALAKEWREEKIIPLREEIDRIIDEINKTWN